MGGHLLGPGAGRHVSVDALKRPCVTGAGAGAMQVQPVSLRRAGAGPRFNEVGQLAGEVRSSPGRSESGLIWREALDLGSARRLGE